MTISDLLLEYIAHGKIITGTTISAFQELSEDEKIKVILNAKGRDIIIKSPGSGIIDGLEWVYTGKKDITFNKKLKALSQVSIFNR